MQKIFLILLLIVLPLVSSNILSLFGVPIGPLVEGNYEFTKVMAFNTISALLILLYGFKLYTHESSVHLGYKQYKIIIIIYVTLAFSTILSLSPLTSFFGTRDMGHSFLMFNNLIALYIILYNELHHHKHLKKHILPYVILGGVLVSGIGIKEFFIPSVDYGEFGSRLISTFGQANYVALYLLLIIPFLFKKCSLKHPVYLASTSIIVAAIILTKSYIGIAMLIVYSLYYWQQKRNKYSYSVAIIGGIFILVGFLLSLYFGIIPHEKLHSFISRWYIWETMLHIQFQDIKTLIIGNGLGTLGGVFDAYKAPELYIFENYGYHADKVHNIFLEIWYNFGLIGLGIFLYLVRELPSYQKKKSPHFHAIILALFFLFFHFASIVSYLLLIFYIASLAKKHPIPQRKIGIFWYVVLFFTFLSLSYSPRYYLSEVDAYKGNYELAVTRFHYQARNYYKQGDIDTGRSVDGYDSEAYFLANIYTGNDLVSDCHKLTYSYPSVENYFYCGETLEKFEFYETARSYYEKGIQKLPDLWNPESIYYRNIFTKNSINLNRFYSEKYGNIQEVLKKMGEIE